MSQLYPNKDGMFSVEAVFALAHEAEAFFNTEIGQYVAISAYEQSKAAQEKLAEVDPLDTKEIIKLQIEHRSAIAGIQFLNEKIREARLVRSEETM